MKKIKLFVLIVAVIGLALAACGGDDDSHSHTYSSSWSSNGTQHWKECSCGDKNGTANHTGNPCSVCGYTVGTLSGNVTISGTLTTGTLLTATYSGSENVSFQWKRDSVDVGTGKTFRPLKSGSLTVTVSATGYTNKSETVTVTGSNANMFWWGNYIPETVLQANQMGSAVFNLNDLVTNRDNGRKRYNIDWDFLGAMENDFSDDDWEQWDSEYGNANNIIINQDGTKKIFYNTNHLHGSFSKYASGGTLRWEEKKSFETASKVDKTINQNPLGYVYFIYPKSFGEIKVRESDMTDISSTWTKHTSIIDGIDYYVYRKTGAMSTTNSLQYIFDFEPFYPN